MSQNYYVQESPGPGCLIRVLYFLFFGVAIGPVWIAVSWFLIITIVGMPLGLWMINRLPQVMTLKPPRPSARLKNVNGQWVVVQADRQAPFILRALYFLLIGWWFSLVWMLLAWLFGTLTLGLGLPLTFWMIDQVPAVTTLSRN